jgi:hypothetical protein
MMTFSTLEDDALKTIVDGFAIEFVGSGLFFHRFDAFDLENRVHAILAILKKTKKFKFD